MKRCIWAVCLLFISLSASSEIKFLENPVWSTVLEKAKKENKMIFLDGYATWCGPCKKMDAETYKDQAVADYYNVNFINVKYDMEKGEGPMLAERYFVNAYPNLLFINPEGVLLHKGVGYNEAADFVTLGKAAKDPNSQYYTLKKNAINLTNAQFLKFAETAVAFEDDDFDDLSNNYLSKQADVLVNNDLIKLVMEYVNTLPDEKTLAYVINNKAKIVSSTLYTKDEVEEKVVSLTLGYALSDAAQTNPEEMDFEVLKTLAEKYIPEKAFFVYNYFKVQFAINEKKIDDAVATLDVILSNVPDKVTFDQACNAMMNIAPILAEESKLDASLKKFEAIKLIGENVKNAYMKNYVKAIIYLKGKDFVKFKEIANLMIANADTPESVKADLKTAIERMN
ncbi:DUF255 domain-containing protein [Pedobacter polaris]|uniref:DUF255 domain-containing protein n=1 Tax=Pedobacter polaris TaxID=2571273 RepID=A0A4U1CVM2_9SPHI|nr:DUF255 domain-containing protein [Pedobacter polaris]TKC12736.1 DUF255 domain-containing protein [Pedobacter polaris]